MNSNAKTHLIEIPTRGGGALVWNRLHSEREDICDALIKDSRMGFGADLTTESSAGVLRARLQKIDDALDRVMSGSHGICSKCNQAIEEVSLEYDVAISLCGCCREQSQSQTLPILQSPNEVVLERLESFDTILVRTLNTDYRILLLDPKTGRALVEGGQYFVEPKEAWVSGSTLPDSPFKLGSIVIGSHLEMWVDDNFVRTSRVQSLRVEHHQSAESIEAITEAIH